MDFRTLMETLLSDAQYDKAKQEAGALSAAENVREVIPECCLTCKFCFHLLEACESKCMRPDGPTYSLAGTDAVYVVCDGWKSNI